jgi:hypothetical protein
VLCEDLFGAGLPLISSIVSMIARWSGLSSKSRTLPTEHG